MRTAYLAITAGLDIDKLVIEDTGLKNIYKSLYNSIRGEGEQANNLMVLFLSAGSIEQGFQTFLRINNSGEPVSKADLCLASISCHWPDARSHFERLEKVLIPSEQDPFYRELGAADVYRQIILQASLIAATSGDPKVEVEIEHFDPVVSVKIKENKDLISEALIKSRNLINYLKISNTNRGLRQVVFYLFYKFEDQVKAENAGPFIRSLHIGWFNNQTTEAAKLGRCIRLMQISHTVEDALRSVINEIGTLTLDEVSSLEFGKRPTTKLLQILKAAEGHYNPMDRYAVDHLHPTARTNEYLNSLPERERAIFEHERNKLPNLQLLDVRINSGTKSGKHLAVWLADHPDQRAILLPFPHTDDQLQLDKAYEFWNLRRIDLEKQIKKLFYLKPHEPGQEVFELPGSPV